MRHIYSFILYCLTPFVLLRLFVLGFKSPGYWLRWNERLGKLPPLEDSRSVFWVHAVSVGEVEAAAPLIYRLIAELPQYQVIVTTVTPTGAQTVNQRFSNDVVHFYLPYDLPFSIRRFLRRVNPAICLIMETEIWPNLYHYCKQGNVPVVIANARMSLRSLKGYQKLNALTRETLNCASLVLAQSKLDADRFISLGCSVERVKTLGNLKFDIEIPVDLRAQSKKLRQELFPHEAVWIAASTHENEERMVLEAFDQLVDKNIDCLLIIAPRHPQRFEQVGDLCLEHGLKVVRRSQGIACDSNTQVLLLDTLGELRLFYACADIAFVGGSLVEAGGHNMLEPASLGVPTISGTHIENFREISKLLMDADALCLVENSSELAQKVMILLADANRRSQMGANGQEMVASNRGSTDKLFIILLSLIE